MCWTWFTYTVIMPGRPYQQRVYQMALYTVSASEDCLSFSEMHESVGESFLWLIPEVQNAVPLLIKWMTLYIYDLMFNSHIYFCNVMNVMISCIKVSKQVLYPEREPALFLCNLYIHSLSLMCMYNTFITIYMSLL